ncbi:MAG: tetratricopeptide repeat protein [Verrucomicrobia bacterium]|nr:tetratricopeptide repeat protein [Verrucomicrobiota bacterium]
MFPSLALGLIPLLCFAGLEILLRAAGYGYPTGFFLPKTNKGEKIFVENEQFGWRFFPPHLARHPLPVSLSADKPEGTIRIFVLGESAAMGDPEPAFGFSRILEVLLRERFPGIRFEVVNVAFTAINSHVIVPIARDCAKQHGDLWVVYMGNNEVMGPFGAGTIFSRQSPPLSIVRGSLALKRLRVGQLVDRGLDRWFGAKSGLQHWRGMEMFLEQQIRSEDPRLVRVYEHFRNNLAEIIRLGVRSGAKVIVSTVASNLRDSAPFASLHAPGLDQKQVSEWERIYKEGSILEADREHARAIDRYLAAGRIDASFAELQFRLGRCYLALSNAEEAQRRYALARDLDTLRFRTDFRLNTILRQVSAGRERQGVYLTDAAELTARNSAGGMPGDEFFFDHVHFNFEGNYLMARILAEQAAAALHDQIGAKDKGAWASSEICARRLALSEWNRYQMHETMQRRLLAAPFTNQLNHAVRQQRYLAKLAEIQPKVQPAALQQAAEVYRQALALAPQDVMLHENFAKLLIASGDTEAAVVQFQQVIELWPHFASAYYNIGHLLKSQGEIDQSERFFQQALELNPRFGEAYNGLGSILNSQGKIEQAMEFFAKAIRLKPGLWEAQLNFALALEKKGQSKEAAERFKETLRLNPNSYLAHLHLGDLLANQGDVLAALNHYTAAVKLQPEAALALFKTQVAEHPQEAMAHFRLANALASLEKRTEATESLRKAAELGTGFWEARYLLGVELATQGRLDEAQGQFLDVIRIRPDFALAHLNLGVALAKKSRLKDAADQFRETLRLEPTNHAARQYLQTLKSLTNSVP